MADPPTDRPLTRLVARALSERLAVMPAVARPARARSPSTSHPRRGATTDSTTSTCRMRRGATRTRSSAARSRSPWTGCSASPICPRPSSARSTGAAGPGGSSSPGRRIGGSCDGSPSRWRGARAVARHGRSSTGNGWVPGAAGSGRRSSRLPRNGGRRPSPRLRNRPTAGAPSRAAGRLSYPGAAPRLGARPVDRVRGLRARDRVARARRPGRALVADSLSVPTPAAADRIAAVASSPSAPPPRPRAWLP